MSRLEEWIDREETLLRSYIAESENKVERNLKEIESLQLERTENMKDLEQVLRIKHYIKEIA